LDLSVIIVNYNGKQDLLRCLVSLQGERDTLDLEVIVTDNGSTDGSVEAARNAYPWVQFELPGQNLGFAAGCNLGLAKAQGRHAMLLNPDTEVLPGSLCRLVTALDEHPGWGIIGPRMLNPQDHPYSAARRFPTPFYLFCECTRLAYIFPHSRLFAGYFYGEHSPETLDSVDQVEGSALVISGPARQTIGDLDNRFFLFFEEVDWCRRVIGAGFEVHIVKTAAVRHHRSTTMSRFYIEARKANARSAMLYFCKHHNPARLRSLRRWMSMGLCIRIAATTVAGWFGGGERAKLKAEGARAERQVYRQGLPSCP
jgi:N-acetylglucosaminyl-diphospho-decaprenol L-rhamnosyltransferase